MQPKRFRHTAIEAQNVLYGLFCELVRRLDERRASAETDLHVVKHGQRQLDLLRGFDELWLGIVVVPFVVDAVESSVEDLTELDFVVVHAVADFFRCYPEGLPIDAIRPKTLLLLQWPLVARHVPVEEVRGTQRRIGQGGGVSKRQPKTTERKRNSQCVHPDAPINFRLY